MGKDYEPAYYDPQRHEDILTRRDEKGMKHWKTVKREPEKKDDGGYKSEYAFIDPKTGKRTHEFLSRVDDKGRKHRKVVKLEEASDFKNYLAYFENNQEWLDKCVGMILQHGFLLDTYNERYFKQDFIYDLEQSYGLGNLAACNKLFKIMLPKIKKLAMDRLIGGKEKAVEYCMTAIEQKRRQMGGFGHNFFKSFGIPWAAKMYFAKRLGTADDMETPPGSIGYLINQISSALSEAYRFSGKGREYVKRIAELFINSEKGNRYLEDLASKCEKELDESRKVIKLNESDLHKIIKSVIREMDELSPLLLQRAADKAYEKGRWSQYDAFEDEAGKRAWEEFGADPGVLTATPKKFSYVAAAGGACTIFRDGTYVVRTKTGYNNENGSIVGCSEFPKQLRGCSKRTARMLEKWWNTYNQCEKPVPCMQDWHNFIEW
jgi:hypothetical protein